MQFLKEGWLNMPNVYLINMRIIGIILASLWLTACDSLPDPNNIFGNKPQAGQKIEEFQLAVTNNNVTDYPWLLAQQENNLDFSSDYKFTIKLVVGTHNDNIDKFVKGEVSAISINNIDAISQLVRQNVRADVVLVSSLSNGNEAILLPENSSVDIRGQRFALTEFSARHYLLDRYLVRNQIPFDQVSIVNTDEDEILNKFSADSIFGVVTENPNITRLVTERKAKNLFDSRQIPYEIEDLLVIRREILEKNPKFAQALLATWFSVMERLQGTRRSATLDSITNIISNLGVGGGRADLDSQLSTVQFIDNPTTALSTIRRDRIMRKTMRHIRYFMERHELAGQQPFTEWVSYPGRDPAILHFNAKPLQDFVAPPDVKR